MMLKQSLLLALIGAFAVVQATKGKSEDQIPPKSSNNDNQNLLATNAVNRGRNYDHGVLSVNITVSDAPKLVGLLDELNNPEGTNATITCSIGSGNLDGLVYEWFKDEDRLPGGLGGNKIRIDIPSDNYQSVLRVFNLDPSDAALYSCVAKNRFGQDKITTKLNVKVQLKWISQPTELTVSVGRSIHVPCSAYGSPAPQVEWFKLGEGQARESLGSNLRFTSTEPEHSGHYECRASNGADEDLVATISLHVLVTAHNKKVTRM